MAFTTREADRMIPNNISDVGLTDEDSGLRLFRGMMSPWDQIKSFKETYNFLIRHAALYAVAYVNALKIIEPSYEKRTTAMSSIWGEMLSGLWTEETGMLDQFRERWDIPPFIKGGMIMTANYADKGDEQMLMSGHVRYASNDLVEKEIHTCQFDIVGPEACDVSQGGGQCFCVGLAGEPLNNYNPERMGCGDPYCIATIETKRKYGEHPNDGYAWENWGPPVSGVREYHAPRKMECEFLSTGVYTSPSGATWTAGELYKDCYVWPMFMAYHSVDAIRALVKEEDQEKAKAIVEVMFDTAGKLQFGEWNTRKAAREWMGVPAEVDDGRVLGGYISMILQARCIDWKFTEFTPERTVVECDRAALEMMSQYPELTPAYAAYFNGMAKTLVNAQWVVGLDDSAPEDRLRFVIEKGLYGYRRQKPGYTYEENA
jgi:hypothetical protein